MSPSLPEDRRSQLDGIVQQMTQNGEPDENISAVVNDFKQKYSGQPDPAAQFASAQKQTQARQAANTPSLRQQALSTVQQFGQNIWGAIKGTGQMISDVGQAANTDPMAAQRLYESTVAPQVAQFPKAYEAATGTGQFKGAGPVARAAGTVGYGLAGVTPGVGPLAARGGEKGGQGDIPGAIADIGTAAAMGVAPEYVGKAAGAAAGKVRQFATPNPDVTLYQAVPFRHEMPDYYDMAPTVRADIKRAALQSQGAPPSTAGVGGGWQPNTPATPAQLTGSAPLNDIPSVLKATQAAKAENRGVMDMHVDPYRNAGWTGSGAPIADEIVNAIPATLRARAQAGIQDAVAEVQRIVQESNVYRRPFTPDEIFGLSKEFNAGLNNHFLKTADQQHALIGQGGDTASLKAAAQGTRNLIRQSFGDDVSQLQRQWGWLDDVESGLRDQWKKVTKSPEETPASDLDAAMLKAGIPGKLTHGNVTGAKFAFRGGKTNSLLQDTFDNTEPGWPLPTPVPGGMPGLGGMPRTAPPSRQLPPAPPQIGRNYVPATGMQTPPGGPMTGGMPPGPQQNVWQGIGAPRQLPAGSPTQGQGVVQVPPPGAANQAGATGTLNQIPPAPRTAAPPADTSFVRGVPVPASDPTFYKLPIAQQMAKQVWEATKPKVEEAPAPAPETPAPAAATPEAEAPAKVTPAVVAKAKRQAPPGSVTSLDKALGVLNEGMAKTRQTPPGTPPPQAAPPVAAPAAQAKPPVAAPRSAPESLSDAQIAEAQKVSGIKDQLENVKYYQFGAGSRLPTAAIDRAAAISELLESMDPAQAKRILEAGQ